MQPTRKTQNWKYINWQIAFIIWQVNLVHRKCVPMWAMIHEDSLQKRVNTRNWISCRAAASRFYLWCWQYGKVGRPYWQMKLNEIPNEPRVIYYKPSIRRRARWFLLIGEPITSDLSNVITISPILLRSAFVLRLFPFYCIFLHVDLTFIFVAFLSPPPLILAPSNYVGQFVWRRAIHTILVFHPIISTEHRRSSIVSCTISISIYLFRSSIHSI